MKRMKLFPKTFLYTLFLMVVITLIGHALIYALMPIVYVNQKESVMKENHHQMVQRLQKMDIGQAKAETEKYTQQNQVFARLNYNGESLVYGSIYIQNITGDDNSHFSFQASPFDGKAGELPPNTIEIENGIVLYPSAEFIRTEETFTNPSGQSCSLETMITLQPVSEAKNVVLEILPFTLLICLIISVAFALFYSKRLTSPITHISKTTEQMEKMDRQAVCEVNSEDEIGKLAENVNFLYKSLLSTIDSLQKEINHVSEIEKSKVEFMRAASHELKTPVTAVGFMLDNMMLGVGKFKDYDTYLPKCKGLIEKLSEMIGNILDTSKLNFSAGDEEVQDVPLVKYLTQMLDPYLLIAKTKGLLMEVDVPDTFTVKIPPHAFSKAVSNVLSNAVNYTAPGGKIRVYTEKQQLIIENECTPLATEHLEHIFEPFYRPDFSRAKNSGGSGLGLYITAQILIAYHFRYSFVPFNKGMRFKISF
ncbi:MAG: HAMP domain-containing sensor histidine kinase [Clostridium sp.]|uniref:HAMP domain-containing sensor histidine kinase n=1 Tax=Clostridium sp. TaxID=1506 RepID=UPI002908AECC|nr:HAMP domain-containing sensor histidine kinase [Clostridium sp.]MDU7336639.1 HAMP domain-containing sensor histidine kinase [Clostridium sp.]